jgi:hypothetical protein
VPGEEALQRPVAEAVAAGGKCGAQLLHRDVRRLRQQREDQRRLRLDPAGAAITAQRTGPDVTPRPRQRPPAADARRADPEAGRRRPVAGTRRHGGEDTGAEIDRQRLDHVCRPPIRQTV